MIKVQEPFKKTWSDPQIIISRDDIIEYEKSQSTNKERQTDAVNVVHDDKLQETTCISQNSNIVAAPTNELEERLHELRNSLLQAEFIKRQLTPRKCINIEIDSGIRSDVSSISSQDSDWMIPELSRSRSLPSSPVIGSMSHMTSSPRIPTNQERYFSFLPERLRDLESMLLSPEYRLRTENDEIDNGQLPHGFCSSNRGGERFDHGCSIHTPNSFEEKSRCSPIRETIDPHPQYLNTPLRAKRKLDMDEDPYLISVKRTKTDLAQEAGIRYISQLEMDLMSLKHRLHYAYPEMTNKPTNCACAEMEKHFMKMATSAYQSIRRYDGTMNSFDRFKQELTQTNQVIKDSMELLQNVRRLCVH